MQKDKSQQLATLDSTTSFESIAPLSVEVYKGALNKANQFQALENAAFVSKFGIWLRVFCSDHGLKEPTKEQAARMATFLKQHFGRFTFTDLKAAATMMLVGKLKPVKFFGTVTLQGVCELLNNYKQERGKMLKDVRNALPVASGLKTIEQIESLELEYWNRVNEMFEAYKQDDTAQISDLFLNTKTFNTMRNAGLVVLPYSVLKATHNAATQYANKRLKTKLTGLQSILKRAYKEQHKQDGVRVVWVEFILGFVFAEMKRENKILDVQKLVNHELQNYRN